MLQVAFASNKVDEKFFSLTCVDFQQRILTSPFCFKKSSTWLNKISSTEYTFLKKYFLKFLKVAFASNKAN